MKAFDFKFCKLIAGTIYNKQYYITDGHVLINTSFFTPKIDKGLQALVDARIEFIQRSKKEKPETSTTTSGFTALDITRAIPQGPRYILTETGLTHTDSISGESVSILRGHDRLVCLHESLMQVIQSGKALTGPLNFLQNYDRPLGPVCIYSQSQDYETETPIAVVMPMRTGMQQDQEISSAIFGSHEALVLSVEPKGNVA